MLAQIYLNNPINLEHLEGDFVQYPTARRPVMCKVFLLSRSVTFCRLRVLTSLREN
jgi:hypothetical protein